MTPGDSHWMLSIPGITTGPKEEVAEMPVGKFVVCPRCACSFIPEVTLDEPVDDGYTPEERRKMELEEDPGFKKYRMMKKMGVLLINIRRKIIQEDLGYTIEDLNLFADKEEIEAANQCII